VLSAVPIPKASKIDSSNVAVVLLFFGLGAEHTTPWARCLREAVLSGRTSPLIAATALPSSADPSPSLSLRQLFTVETSLRAVNTAVQPIPRPLPRPPLARAGLGLCCFFLRTVSPGSPAAAAATMHDAQSVFSCARQLRQTAHSAQSKLL
jgi:hypothetical protein